MKIQDIVKIEHHRQVDEFEKVVKANVERFLDLHKRHPLPNHHPSYVSLSEAFWLWRLAEDLNPGISVESGTFHGYSAWWLDQGMSNGDLTTFDTECCPHEDVTVELSKGGRWQHRLIDFSLWDAIVFNEALIFFDDHIDQRQRLDQAVEKGFKHIIFHDCYSYTGATKPEPLWNRGIGRPAYVIQFPVIRQPAQFSEPANAMHSWLTYVQIV